MLMFLMFDYGCSKSNLLLSDSRENFESVDEMQISYSSFSIGSRIMSKVLVL